MFGILMAVVLVAGFVVVGLLFVWVVRNAPPDGSDIGMAQDETADREP